MNSSTTRVFPLPASPVTDTSRPWPAAASANSAARTRSSSSRPTKTLPRTSWGSMYGGPFIYGWHPRVNGRLSRPRAMHIVPSWVERLGAVISCSPVAEGTPSIGSGSAERGRRFGGRRREMEVPRASLRSASAGHGQLVAIGGDAGIGKTRTVEEFIARARIPEDRLLWGRCADDEGVPAYWPWAQAIRGHVERSDTDVLRTQLGSAASEVA